MIFNSLTQTKDSNSNNTIFKLLRANIEGYKFQDNFNNLLVKHIQKIVPYKF